MLPKRPCHLREDDHKYVWDETGEQMTISVTGVTSHGKPPVDYSKYPEAAPRGTHVHRAMEALAYQSIELGWCKKADAEGDELAWEAAPEAWDQFMDHHGTTSPEGVDCTPWIDQLVSMPFWSQIEVLGCEFTMVHRKKSLGGQLDLLCVFKDKCLLVDLKTKSKSWKAPNNEDIYSYKAQAGGYLYLLHSGDDAGPGQIVDQCRTLVVTPTQVKWLPPMDPDDCYFAWEECWDKYSASLETSACPF